MKISENQEPQGTDGPTRGQKSRSGPIGGSRAQDETLVGRCRRGNMAAFGQLTVKYQHRLFNAILRIVGNHDDALELTQEAFVRALQGLKNFRGQAGFYTWLFRIGVNLSLNHRQRQKHVSFTSLQGQAEEFGGQADGLAALIEGADPSPAHQAQMQEEHQRVLAAMEKLDDNARAVVVLRDIEGFSYAEIGEILETPVGTVKSRISRARMALREVLLAKKTQPK